MRRAAPVTRAQPREEAKRLIEAAEVDQVQHAHRDDEEKDGGDGLHGGVLLDGVGRPALAAGARARKRVRDNGADHLGRIRFMPPFDINRDH